MLDKDILVDIKGINVNREMSLSDELQVIGDKRMLRGSGGDESWLREYEKGVSLEVENVDDLRIDFLKLLKYVLKYGNLGQKLFAFKEGSKYVFEMRKSLRSNVTGNIVFKIDKGIHGDIEEAVVIDNGEEVKLLEEVSEELEKVKIEIEGNRDGNRDRVSED